MPANSGLLADAQKETNKGSGITHDDKEAPHSGDYAARRINPQPVRRGKSFLAHQPPAPNSADTVKTADSIEVFFFTN